jgi:hypothetical protein
MIRTRLTQISQRVGGMKNENACFAMEMEDVSLTISMSKDKKVVHFSLEFTHQFECFHNS